MPLPSAPKVEGDILARREYGARVKPEDLKKTAKPVKAKAPAAVKAKTAKKGSKSATKTPDAKALKHEKPAKSPRPAAPALKLPGKAAKEELSVPKEADAGASRLRKGRAAKTADKPRVFVLDTNVLLHDPMSIFRFEEHDVFLPMTTLEELDNHKTGVSDIARTARQVSRSIDHRVCAPKCARKPRM